MTPTSDDAVKHPNDSRPADQRVEGGAPLQPRLPHEPRTLKDDDRRKPEKEPGIYRN